MANQNDSNADASTNDPDVSRERVLDSDGLPSSMDAGRTEGAETDVDTASHTISSCTTIDTPGEYVFGSDVTSSADTCIEITANNVVLDGRDRELRYTGDSDGSVGIRITGSNVVVKNVIIEGWGTCILHRGYGGALESNDVNNVDGEGDTGIVFDTAVDVLVHDNDVDGFDWGLELRTSFNNAIRDNSIGTLGAEALVMNGSHGNEFVNNEFLAPSALTDIESSNNNVFESNTLPSGSGGGFDISNSVGNELLNNVVFASVEGIDLSNTTNTVVRGNVVTQNSIRGVRLYQSDHCELANNVVRNNGGGGVELEQSNHCELTNNVVKDNNQYGLSGGISLTDADQNFLSGNVVCNNEGGDQIILDADSDGNALYDNVTNC